MFGPSIASTKPRNESILTDIDINLPNLQSLRIFQEYIDLQRMDGQYSEPTLKTRGDSLFVENSVQHYFKNKFNKFNSIKYVVLDSYNRESWYDISSCNPKREDDFPFE